MKALVAALLLLAAVRALAADDCKPLKTDDDKISWYCLQHADEGSDCAAHARLLLPYISDYANCSGVDDAGRALDGDQHCSFSPLPPDCPQPPASGAGRTGGATGGTVPPTPTTPPKPVPGAGAWQPPTTCQPKKVGDVMVYMAQRCMFQPVQPVDGGHAPLSWGATGAVGSGAAVFFVPKEGGGEFISIGTPGVPSSPNCRISEDIFDAKGNPIAACHADGSTNDNGNMLYWAAGAKAPKGGCSLAVGGQYYIVYRLVERRPNPYAPPDLQNLCGMTVDTSQNIERY